MAYGYEEFKKDVYKLTNINLDMYKERQMKRRIETLYSNKGYKDWEAFYKGMKHDGVLLRTFVGYITINVSEFYRNPNQWEILEKNIIPQLLSNKKGKLTIWSAACSTGDEPYTLAMLFSKHMLLSDLNIIATDLDEDVLNFARNGIYSKKSIVGLPPEYVKKHFDFDGDNQYIIHKDIKQCVKFQQHNLLEDPYFKNVDLIVCRNVVIYFTDEAKNHVYNGFYESLVNDGVLFIGSTEQIYNAKEIGFSPIQTFFFRKIKK